MMKEIAINAAYCAGEIHRKYFNKQFNLKRKGKNDFYTNVDIESSKIIKNTILNRFPEHNLICEETGEINNDSDYTWIIDPLDGTHNYIIGNPQCGISIAVRHKEEIVLGAVHFPILEQMYYAEKGNGAYCNRSKINVNNKSQISNSFFLCDFELKNNEVKQIEIINRFLKKVCKTRSFGASIYNNLLVATGKADFNLEFYSEIWDHSAALLIVTEAGGTVTDFYGNKWKPEMKSYVSSNGKIHSEILTILNQS